MPKFAKRFLVVLAALAAAIALILLFINLYLQSGGVQERIHDAVVRSLGADVRIQSTSFTPWRGLVLKDIRVPDPMDASADFVDAKELHIHFAFLPLFQQRFIVTDCTLTEPRLIIRQVEGGNWMVPLPAKLPPTASNALKPSPGASGAMRALFRAELHRFHLNNGYVAFVDAKKRVVLELEKAKIDAEIAPDLTAIGTIEVSQVNISGSLKPRKISGPFSWNGDTLNLPELTGTLAGGKVTGNYRVAAIHTKPTYALAMDLKEVSLPRLISEAGYDASKAAGQLQGTLQLTGDPRTSDNTTGTAHFELISAQLKPVEFLSQLGTMLQIEELQLLQLKEAKADLSIRDKRVFVDTMLLKSENLALHANGTIKFNGKINLTAQLLIDQKLQQQLGFLAKNFSESDDPEYRKVDFTVWNRLQSPQTDLLNKLVGMNLGNMGGLLKDIFHAIPASSAKPAEPEPTTTPASGN